MRSFPRQELRCEYFILDSLETPNRDSKNGFPHSLAGDLARGVGGDPLEEVLEIGLRVQADALGRLDQALEDRRPVALLLRRLLQCEYFRVSSGPLPAQFRVP